MTEDSSERMSPNICLKERTEREKENEKFEMKERKKGRV